MSERERMCGYQEMKIHWAIIVFGPPEEGVNTEREGNNFIHRIQLNKVLGLINVNWMD